MCLYNEATDHLVIIGKVDNINFTKLDPQNQFSTDVISGQMVNSDGQPTFCGFQLKGKFVEVLDPNTVYLMMKNCGTPTLSPDCSIRTAVEDYIAYKDRAIKLKHNVGFYGVGALPPPEMVTGVAFGAGGTIPTDDYIFVVTCMYGETESAHELTSTPTEIAVIVGQKVLLTITPPTDGIPDAYKIYIYNDGETIADATLLLTIPSPGTDPVYVIIDEAGRTGALYPGDADSSFSIEDSEGNIFNPGDDYTVDYSCATVIFEEDGDLEDGEKVTITYTYRVNPNIEMSIGPMLRLPPYVHPVIIALKSDDRAVIRPRGVEIDLWKVLASSDWNWDLSSLNYESGYEFTWDVLLSEKTLNHGRIQLFNRHLVAYPLENLATLTDWANGPGCEEES
jgi:hypothetical protein